MNQSIDSRVDHRGMGGFGYCVDCGTTRPGGLCAPKRDAHPIIFAREARQLKTQMRDGTETTILYGPFLPHIGGACTALYDALAYADEWEADPYVTMAELSIETVFIGDGESDAVVSSR